MEANSILRSSLLDILFENRNKEYGAYDLRKTYNKRIIYAVTGVSILCLLMFVISIFASSKNTTVHHDYVGPEVNLSTVKDDHHEVVKPPEVRPRIQPVETRRDVPPIIVPDHLVNKQDIVPRIDELSDSVRIGDANVHGTPDVVAPPINQTTGDGNNNTLSKNTGEIDHPIIVEIEAQFPGGINSWTRFLKTNLDNNILVDNGAPAGKYTVVVSFLVDKDGNISEVQALNDPGYGTAEEAVRVIKKSKQWEPAIQNGQHVIYRQKQSITFVVEEQ
jgi:periplasmic protein TonB